MKTLKDLQNILDGSPKLNYILERPQTSESIETPLVLFDYDRDVSSFFADNKTLTRRGSVIAKFITKEIHSPQYNSFIKKLNDNGIFYTLINHFKNEKSELWESDYLITFNYNTSSLTA